MRTAGRALAALTLIATVTLTAGSAGGAPEGASQSLFVVDIVVIGTAPTGASITVRVPDATTKDAREHVVELSTVNDTPPDIVTDVGIISRHLFVDPALDAGAASVEYECELTGPDAPPDPQSFCEGRTAGDVVSPGPHVYAEFWGNVNQHANATITLTFGACDGRAATVFLVAGDVPTPGDDVILGTAGPDTVTGHGGNDRICGRGGADVLRGGEGRDRIFGGGGADRLEGGQRGDTLLGGPGADLLLGLAGNDALDGGGRRDTCNGGTERDTGIRCEVRNGIP